MCCRYPESFNVHEVVEQHAGHPVWGWAAAQLLQHAGGAQLRPPSRVGHDAGDHPPITPVSVAQRHDLHGNEWALYEVRATPINHQSVPIPPTPFNQQPITNHTNTDRSPITSTNHTRTNHQLFSDGCTSLYWFFKWLDDVLLPHNRAQNRPRGRHCYSAASVSSRSHICL